MSNEARNQKNGGGGIMANWAVSRSGGEYFYTVHYPFATRWTPHLVFDLSIIRGATFACEFYMFFPMHRPSHSRTLCETWHLSRLIMSFPSSGCLHA